MKYFYVNLAAHLLVFIALVVAMLICLRRNNKKQTKHGFVYLAPVVCATLAVLYMVFLAGPRILDIKNITSDTYQMTTGKIETIGYLNNTVTVEGKKFYINPLADIPKEGTIVRIKYTEYGNYVLELSEASQNTITSDSVSALDVD